MDISALTHKSYRNLEGWAGETHVQERNQDSEISREIVQTAMVKDLSLYALNLWNFRLHGVLLEKVWCIKNLQPQYQQK